jgi:hypothetical protein
MASLSKTGLRTTCLSSAEDAMNMGISKSIVQKISHSTGEGVRGRVAATQAPKAKSQNNLQKGR